MKSALLMAMVVAALSLSYSAHGRAIQIKTMEVPNTAKGFDEQYHQFVKENWKAKKEDRGNL